MNTDPSDRATLRVAGRRFLWMTLVLYAGLTIGLWAAHATFPSALGAVTNYTIEVSLIAAIAFGGLYAAAQTLRPIRPKASRTVDQP